MFTWIAEARCKDGTWISKEFPYMENGNYSKECERQYELECWLVENHDVEWFGVALVED